MEEMSMDGTLQMETSTNPYDVLAMEEESTEETEDAEMEAMKRASPRHPATKRDDRSVDTKPPNHKAKKIQKGEALREAAELAKDEYRYMDIIGKSGMMNISEESKSELELMHDAILEGINITMPGTHTVVNVTESDKKEGDQEVTVAESSKSPEQEAQEEMLKAEEPPIDEIQQEKK